MRNRFRHSRRKSGVSLVEFTAALVFGLPLVMIMLYAVIEASLLFSIRANLDSACRQAAQKLIDDYVNNGTTTANNLATPSPLPAALQFDIMSGDGHYFVNRAANQFVVQWNTDATGHKTVTVIVYYPNSDTSHNIVRFPYPDPMHMGGSFKIWSCGTFAAPS